MNHQLGRWLPRAMRVLTAVLAVGIWLGEPSNAAASPVQLWERYSRGFGVQVQRPKTEAAMCSFQEPICIHAATGTTEQAVVQALATAERAMRLFRGLGLPPPMPDGSRGGSSAFDVYLGSPSQLAPDPFVAPNFGSRAHVDPVPASVGFDRPASYATVFPGRPGPACGFDSDIARVVSQGMILAIDGGIQEGLLAAHSSWLAHAAAPCAPLALEAIDRVQRRPDLAIVAASADSLSGNMLFPWFLDDVYGTGTHGAVMTALFATSCQLTPSGNRFYVNEPDTFDALRQVTLDRQMNFGELLIEYAIARAFMGDRSDAAHLVDVDWLDTLGRVRFEWAFGWKDLPKRVAPAYPLEPTGAAYIWVDLADKPANAEALIVADWEATHVFQWAVVRMDESGREIGRHLLGGIFGEAQAQLQLRDLSETAALLIVGTHEGNDDRSRAYDPESGAPRVASYMVTVHAQ